MHGGIENDVFRVAFASGVDAVAHIYRTKTPQQVEGEAQLLRLMDGHGKCVSLIESPGAENPLQVDGHPMTLIKFIHGDKVDRACFTRDLLAQIGSSLSDLHEISRGRCLRTHWGLPELLHQGQMLIVRHLGYPQHREYVSLLARELNVVQSLINTPADHVMIHADVDEGNLILDKSRDLWLVDFDDCGYAPAPLDIAITVRNLVLKRLVRDRETPGLSICDAAGALLEGYRLPLTKLGTWTRVACFRHAILMLENSYCNPLYPSRNDDNFRLLEASRLLEQDLNALSA